MALSPEQFNLFRDDLYQLIDQLDKPDAVLVGYKQPTYLSMLWEVANEQPITICFSVINANDRQEDPGSSELEDNVRMHLMITPLNLLDTMEIYTKAAASG